MPHASALIYFIKHGVRKLLLIQNLNSFYFFSCSLVITGMNLLTILYTIFKWSSYSISTLHLQITSKHQSISLQSHKKYDLNLNVDYNY